MESSLRLFSCRGSGMKEAGSQAKLFLRDDDNNEGFISQVKEHLL